MSTKSRFFINLIFTNSVKAVSAARQNKILCAEAIKEMLRNLRISISDG